MNKLEDSTAERPGEVAGMEPGKRICIPRLEMHVTHSCNLTCDSCSHYSNHGHKGHIDLGTADAWLSNWSGRCDVSVFVLLGGEPSTHPDLVHFIPLVRAHWPTAKILIVTNGFFLARHPALPNAIVKAGHVELSLSVHHNSPRYLERIRPAIELVQTWQRTHGIQAEIVPSHSNWTRRYLGSGRNMTPFEDGNPRSSWNICPAKHCTQIFEGNLWKCAPLSYLKLQDQRFKLSAKWHRYLSYSPLTPECTDEEFFSFLQKEDEDVCSMCPATPRPFTLTDPTVRTSTS